MPKNDERIAAGDPVPSVGSTLALLDALGALEGLEGVVAVDEGEAPLLSLLLGVPPPLHADRAATHTTATNPRKRRPINVAR